VMIGTRCGTTQLSRAPNAMQYADIFVERLENATSEPIHPPGIMRLNAGARIIKSTIRGPLFLNKNSQIGPDAVVGKYFGMNESCFVARAARGAVSDIR